MSNKGVPILLFLFLISAQRVRPATTARTLIDVSRKLLNDGPPAPAPLVKRHDPTLAVEPPCQSCLPPEFPSEINQMAP